MNYGKHIMHATEKKQQMKMPANNTGNNIFVRTLHGWPPAVADKSELLIRVKEHVDRPTAFVDKSDGV